MKYLSTLLLLVAVAGTGLQASEREAKVTKVEFKSFTLPKAYFYADVAWDAKGQAHVVFMPSKKDRRAYYTMQNAKGKWSKPVKASGTLKKVYGMGVNGPSISVSKKGVIHIMLGFKGQIYDSRSTNGEKFKLVPLRQGAEGGTMGGSMIMSEGRIYSAWVDNRDTKKYRETQEVGAGDIYFTESADDGQSFSKPVKISGITACVCCAPNIVAHGDTIVVAYRSTFKAVKEMQMVSSTDGGKTWSKVTQVSKDNFYFKGCLEMRPDMAIDPTGKNVILMWMVKGVYRTAVSSDGGKTFGEPTLAPKTVSYPLQVRWTNNESWIAIPARAKVNTAVLINPESAKFTSHDPIKGPSFYRLNNQGVNPIIIERPKAESPAR